MEAIILVDIGMPTLMTMNNENKVEEATRFETQLDRVDEHREMVAIRMTSYQQQFQQQYDKKRKEHSN